MIPGDNASTFKTSFSFFSFFDEKDRKPEAVKHGSGVAFNVRVGNFVYFLTAERTEKVLSFWSPWCSDRKCLCALTHTLFHTHTHTHALTHSLQMLNLPNT